RRHTRFSRDWSSDVCSSDLFPLDRFPRGECPPPVPAVPLSTRGPIFDRFSPSANLLKPGADGCGFFFYPITCDGSCLASLQNPRSANLDMCRAQALPLSERG